MTGGDSDPDATRSRLDSLDSSAPRESQRARRGGEKNLCPLAIRREFRENLAVATATTFPSA